ncbi:L-1,2-propanediol oxidoreductase [Salmonella enterica subsp. enterica serovar Agona str. 620239]|nr:L-1,2-propanediol oxidoreductase [Salmonella enterica subsp. enterica serovar Agona str. 620239]
MLFLLPHVMRFNAGSTNEKFRDIARAMGVKVEGLSLEEARNAAVEAVFALNRDVGIPLYFPEKNSRHVITDIILLYLNFQSLFKFSRSKAYMNNNTPPYIY